MTSNNIKDYSRIKLWGEIYTIQEIILRSIKRHFVNKAFSCDDMIDYLYSIGVPFGLGETSMIAILNTMVCYNDLMFIGLGMFVTPPDICGGAVELALSSISDDEVVTVSKLDAEKIILKGLGKKIKIL